MQKVTTGAIRRAIGRELAYAGLRRGETGEVRLTDRERQPADESQRDGGGAGKGARVEVVGEKDGIGLRELVRLLRCGGNEGR